MHRSVRAAVTSAQERDAEAFDAALGTLSRLDREQLSTLLGAVVLALLEQRHPDGLDSDDVDQLVESTVRSGAAWYPSTDRDSVQRVIVGALGVSEIDDAERHIDGMTIISHSLLLLAGQLTGAAGVRPLLDYGLGELHRAQTQEMP